MNSDLTPSASVLQQLTAAVEGLVWMSETDAPFEVKLWTEPGPAFTAEQVVQHAQLPPETPVEVLSLEAFLAPVLQSLSSDPVTIVTASRFEALQQILSQVLNQIQVYRCGEVELEIYILGHFQDNDWVVLHTTAVET